MSIDGGWRLVVVILAAFNLTRICIIYANALRKLTK